MRQAPVEIEAWFQRLKTTPSDINEHLELLRELSSQVEHVTEMGMRGAVSTVALLAGQPKTLISWDIDPWAVVSQTVANLVAANQNGGRTSFQPRVGNTLECLTEPTDLLFIDTWHTYDQLLAELVRHANPRHVKPGTVAVCECNVRRFIAFHDTATFGMRGEDGKEPGLRQAIRVFQKNHAFPLWRLREDRQNNNGLVVLEHV